MTADGLDPDTTAETRLDLVYQRLIELRSASDARSLQDDEVRRLTESLVQVEHELEGLRVAMATRAVIEQAKGMLMLREGCDADTAFRMLVDISQRGHRKLVEVASTMVAAWSSGASTAV